MNNHDEQQPIAFGQLMPERDLWPDIESQLTSRRPRKGWAAGIAASLVAMASLTLVTSSPDPFGNVLSSAQSNAYLMQQTHDTEVSALTKDSYGPSIDPGMKELGNAEQQIHTALNDDPDNPALLRMLARIHHQKFELLMKSTKVKDYTT